MHNMEMTLSWLFPHVKYESYFSILTFCIDIYYFVINLLNNVNISTWSLIRQHIFNVNDMTWNVEIT
jgi:hypothetical protein